MAKRKIPNAKSKAAVKKKKKPLSYFKCPQCLCYFKIKEKSSHACIQPTEDNLIFLLSEDCRDAWFALRKFAVSLGEQRIYASAKAIMFSQRVCYFFVRPKTKEMEMFLFLNYRLKNPMVHKIQAYSKSKFAHIIKINHEDQIGEPLLQWIREAWDLANLRGIYPTLTKS